ncbi:hypothetical protein DPMN_017866 [Dreissena polymorpha]|uniref:Uncharacterized protein n=1 Tax=Dreissena polymorpha TaxID=45954 RepID=A0A9D4S6T1_DREPO|nr:hypothetical protein DPMN_017866 [Dreissena polymorpha]
MDMENQVLKEKNNKLTEQLNTNQQAIVGLIGDSFDDDMSGPSDVQIEKSPDKKLGQHNNSLDLSGPLATATPQQNETEESEEPAPKKFKTGKN